jgi:hypothetical protein
MSTLRVLREITMFTAMTSGAAIGYAAGRGFESPVNVILPFFGMALFTGFVDFCMRGGK